MPPASDERPDEAVNLDSSIEPQQRRQAQEKQALPQSQLQGHIPPLSQPPKRAATAPLSSAPASSASSPKTSRDTSPARPSPLKLGQNAPKLSRSRKNSQELSPHRTPNTVGPALPDAPSAAAIQRALSATPRLASPSNSDQTIDPQKPQRTARGPAVGGQNSANTSSRVKSPPNSVPAGRTASFALRKNEHDPSTPTIPATPRIVVDDGAGKPISNNFDAIAEEEDETTSGMRSPVKAKSSGILEVVQESSLPETPAIGVGVPLSTAKPRSSRSSVNETNGKDTTAKPAAPTTESGSESGGNKSATSLRKDAAKSQRIQPTTKPTPLKSTNSYTQLVGNKNKAIGDGSARNMTVETETVTSVPNAGVGGSGQRETSGRTEGGGTLRLKPSSETIRPKKEKKKVVRKAPSVHSGTASSKADIFEAKVASAVDEADSSDSGETFVYESNPPEPSRPHRYHSRTPSAASVVSQADHFGGRYRTDGHNSIVGKKSMKFANNAHHFSGCQGDGENGSNSGTVGSGRGSAANGNHYHHHIGRHGRAPGHTSLFDSDSPFPNAANKTVQIAKHSRVSSRPNSPRTPFTPRGPGSAKSHRSVYNLEDDGADDERTPLIQSTRNSRTRNSRKTAMPYDNYGHFRSNGVFGGVICWLLLGLLVTLLVVAIIVALVLCLKPLASVRVRDIRNVIASEEEIVFDLHVHAINPNILAVQINNVDMKIFAKSKYVGSSRLHDGLLPQLEVGAPSRGAMAPSQSSGTSTAAFHESGGIDEGTDPIEEPGGGDTMLLGRVYALDSPLTFEASPTLHHVASDSGEVSLAYPGNSTADEGSDRWKIVVQHTFELIVVGQLKYTLPISSKVHIVSFGQAKTSVDPNAPVKEKTSQRIGRPTPETATDSRDRRLRLTFSS